MVGGAKDSISLFGLHFDLENNRGDFIEFYMHIFIVLCARVLLALLLKIMSAYVSLFFLDDVIYIPLYSHCCIVLFFIK